MKVSHMYNDKFTEEYLKILRQDNNLNNADLKNDGFENKHAVLLDGFPKQSSSLNLELKNDILQQTDVQSNGLRTYNNSITPTKGETLPDTSVSKNSQTQNFGLQKERFNSKNQTFKTKVQKDIRMTSAEKNNLNSFEKRMYRTGKNKQLKVLY